MWHSHGAIENGQDGGITYLLNVKLFTRSYFIHTSIIVCIKERVNRNNE